jgi:hypothetical protein
MRATFTRLIRWSFLYDNEPFEVFSIFLKVLFGISFFRYDDTPSSVLRAMNSIAPSWMWGVLLLVLAAYHLWNLKPAHFNQRRISIMLGCTFWMFISVIYWIFAPQALAAIFCPALAIFLAWSYLKVSFVQEAKKIKDANIADTKAAA